MKRLARYFSRIAIDKVLFLLAIPAFWVAVVWSMGSCAGEAGKTNGQGRPSAQVFRLPDIPPMVTDPGQRMAYMAAHYWDNLDFADTACLGIQDLEQVFVDYLDVLPRTTRQTADASIRKTLVKARDGVAMWEWFTAQFDRYLYDSDSPLRDEDRYTVVLEHILADTRIDTIYKIAPRFQLGQINKNRLGTVAADFTYTLRNGATGTLHGLRGDYTLVFFGQPDCNVCTDTKTAIQESETINKLLQTGRLEILAIYTGEERAQWAACGTEVPIAWLDAHDASAELVIKNELYAIRAIPTLYLLDKQKRVILKDATPQQIERMLTGK